MLISERIYNLLKEKNISQIDFSRKTGISQSTISDWRRKGTNPSADKIMVICETLDVTPYELLLGAESRNKKKNKQVDAMVLYESSKEYQMIETYRECDDEIKRRIETYIQGVKK